jgi:hypothetical protein
VYAVSRNADASTAFCGGVWTGARVSDRTTSVADRVCGEEALELEEVGFIYNTVWKNNF